MILAYKHGTLIAVKLLSSHPLTTRVEDADKKVYCYRKEDENRKLFKGDNAVYDAIKWIDNQRK